MSISILNAVSMTLVNTIQRVSISVTDQNSELADPFGIALTVQDIYGNVKFTDVWPSPVRIVRSSVGQFYIDFGTTMPNTETNSATEWLFDWAITLISGGSVNHAVEKVKIISAKMASFLPEFRLMIDKTQKIIDSANNCFLGYSDAQLVAYLEGGLSSINSYQPSVNFNFDTYPVGFKQLLLDAGLITGVMSQQLFAIDTDIPNYSDQGTSFVISHQPQLASFLNQITQRLDKMIPQMKLQFVRSGVLHTQMGPGYRLQTLMEASPSGSTFRNVFFQP